MRRRHSLSCLVVSILALAPLAGCSDQEIISPTPNYGPVFARYVALGNSLTAGVQSGGINDSTQQQTYAALLARDLGTSFRIPLLARPGCPPPYVNVFTGERVGGQDPDFCALRERPIQTVLNDVAVPGANIADALSNSAPGTAPNPLTTLLLGGRTQVGAAIDAEPTFISIWLGNNDVLGPALAGDLTDVTPPDVFTSTYTEVVQQLKAAGVQGGLLIGVADVTRIPNLSPAAAYFLASQQSALPPTFHVAPNCAPGALGGIGETTRVPFAYGFGNLVARATAGEDVTLDCAAGPVLTGAEIAALTATVDAYNATISGIADANNWAYFDPNVTLDSLRAAGEIPVFPTATGAEAVTQPFGRWFSKDGVHLSAEGHALLEDYLLEIVLDRYRVQPIE